MKETELRKHATCSLCHRKIGHQMVPLFWRLTVERFGIDLAAMLRQDGLTALLGGNAEIARVMGPDEDLARPVIDPVVLTVCESCMLDHLGLVAEIALDGKDEG